MNKRQEPRLRFQGFMEMWEEKTLNDVSEIFEYGLNAQAINFDGVHKYIRITDIDDESRQFLQENVTSPDVDFSKADNYKLQKGDLLFARTGASVGKSYLYDENDGLVYFAGFLIRAKLKKEVDDQFIFQNTLTNHFNRFITLTSQRSGQPGINSKEYSKFEFLAPSLPEQTHLGLFFRRLDSQIAESRAVLEKSRQLKKAMLAKMFPANGEKIPKIRFKGFEGEWREWKLGAFGKATSGTSLESEFCEDGNYKVISIGSYSEKSTYTDQGIRTHKNDKTEKRILNKNDLTMILNDKTSSGRIIGRVLLIDQNDTYVYNQRTQRIEIDQEHFIPLFLYHLLNADNMRQKIIYSAQGNTQIYVNWSGIKILEYLIPPTKAEQAAIGNFFRQLDETIASQSAEVEKLNQLKKGLLVAMLM